MTQLEACLLLDRLPGIGTQRCIKLLLHFGNASAIFDIKPREWERVPGIGTLACKTLATWREYEDQVKQAIEGLKKYKVKYLFFGSEGYPLPLSYCPDVPLILFYQGTLEFKDRKILSVVGTRRNTPNGRAFCQELIQNLKPYDPIICSGLARGIDVIAHRAALKQGMQTVDRLAHGFDRIYPESHSSIAQEILNSGELLTEFLPEAAFHRGNFTRRNRLIAGMAHATVVIESGEKGGSMNTAILAHQYGRELFVVPGRYSDYKSQECHQLLVEQKAQLISKPEHLIDALEWERFTKPKSIQKEIFTELTQQQQTLIQSMQKNTKVHLDFIALETKQKIGVVAAASMDLEMKGVVWALPGKYY